MEHAVPGFCLVVGAAGVVLALVTRRGLVGCLALRFGLFGVEFFDGCRRGRPRGVATTGASTEACRFSSASLRGGVGSGVG